MSIHITESDLPTDDENLPALKTFLKALISESSREGGNDLNSIVIAAGRTFESIDKRIAALEQK